MYYYYLWGIVWNKKNSTKLYIYIYYEEEERLGRKLSKRNNTKQFEFKDRGEKKARYSWMNDSSPFFYLILERWQFNKVTNL